MGGGALVLPGSAEGGSLCLRLCRLRLLLLSGFQHGRQGLREARGGPHGGSQRRENRGGLLEGLLRQGPLSNCQVSSTSWGPPGLWCPSLGGPTAAPAQPGRRGQGEGPLVEGPLKGSPFRLVNPRVDHRRRGSRYI